MYSSIPKGYLSGSFYISPGTLKNALGYTRKEFYIALSGTYLAGHENMKMEQSKMIKRILGYTISKKSNVLNFLRFPEKLAKYKISVLEESLR